MKDNAKLRASFKDINGKTYDIPARCLLASHLEIANHNTTPEVRYEMVFEGEDYETEGFTNIRVIVSAKTAYRVESLSRRVLR